MNAPSKAKEVSRSVVKLGLDFRPIPVDVGDGTEWLFTSDPSPEQWSTLVNALKVFTKLSSTEDGGHDMDLLAGDLFTEALGGFTHAMSEMLIDPTQQPAWIKRGYGLAPQQAISEVLMEMWSGFPTTQQSPSGPESKKTG